MQRGRIKHLAIGAMTRIAGAERMHRLMLARNFAAYRRTGAIFVHVPKVAGSTISAALYRGSLGHFTAVEMAAYDPDWFARLPSFAVLRDPVERALSAWRYVRSGGTAEGWVAPRAEYDLPEFRDFERFATEWLPSRTAAGDDTLDFVFQTQTRFVCDPAGVVLVDRLFRLDNPAPLSTYLEGATGLGLSRLARRNVNPEGARLVAEIPQAVRKALTEIYARDAELIAGIPTGTT